MSYKIEPLTVEEFETLCWLNDHGYDAGILTHVPSPGELIEISEPDAWKVQEEIDLDPGAFLTCNGSESLNEKIWKFINSIV